MQEVQYFESVLAQGHSSMNYEVTCVLTAQDVRVAGLPFPGAIRDCQSPP